MEMTKKIDKVVQIWVDTGSLSDSTAARNKKYNDILERIVNPADTWTETDLDVFIEGHESGRYAKERGTRK